MHSLFKHPPPILAQIEGTILKKNEKKKLKMNYNLI